MTTNIEIPEIKDLAKAVHEMRQVAESKNAHLAEVKEKLTKFEDLAAKLEEKHQQIQSAWLAKQKEEAEYKERLEFCEKIINRTSSNTRSKGYKESKEYKALQEFAIRGENGLSVETKGYLRTDLDTAGGFLLPTEMSNELEKNIVEISPVRAVARIRRTSSRSLIVPLRTVNLSSTAVGETQAGTISNSTYAAFEIKVNRIVADSALSLEEMQDAAFDMEAQINEDFAIEFARQEGAQFVAGNGVNQANGFTTDPNINVINSGVANGITFDNIYDLTNLKVGYVGMYAMNRSTIIFLQKAKDNVGQYLWQPAVEKDRFNTLNGHPYLMMQDMQSIGAGNVPIVFGDFRVGYTIVDKVGMSLIRDVYTLADQSIIRLIAARRVGGAVTRPEAFNKLLCHT